MLNSREYYSARLERQLRLAQRAVNKGISDIHYQLVDEYAGKLLEIDAMDPKRESAQTLIFQISLI